MTELVVGDYHFTPLVVKSATKLREICEGLSYGRSFVLEVGAEKHTVTGESLIFVSYLREKTSEGDEVDLPSAVVGVKMGEAHELDFSIEQYRRAIDWSKPDVPIRVYTAQIEAPLGDPALLSYRLFRFLEHLSKVMPGFRVLRCMTRGQGPVAREKDADLDDPAAEGVIVVSYSIEFITDKLPHDVIELVRPLSVQFDVNLYAPYHEGEEPPEEALEMDRRAARIRALVDEHAPEFQVELQKLFEDKADDETIDDVASNAHNDPAIQAMYEKIAVRAAETRPEEARVEVKNK